MKSVFKYTIPLLTALAALSCSKDPDVTIYEQLEFSQCIAPINVDFTVKYVDITVECEKTFPDAEKFELQVYSEPFPADGDADDSYLIRKDFIMPDEFPYTFTAPKETTCYLRLRAINETAGKKPSRWVSGYVMTDVDPDLTCAKPSDATTIVNFMNVTFSWVPAKNVKLYELEVYNNPLPALGEPDQSDMVAKFVKAPVEIPFSAQFSNIKKYYFRVRGTNEEDHLDPSGWVKSSFLTQAYTYPSDKNTFDYGYTHNRPRTSTITTEAFSAAGWTVGNKVPAETEYTVDGVTYGPDVLFEDGDRVNFAQCNKWDKNYANNFPLNRYVCIKVNKPGSISFIVRLSGSTAPNLIVGVKTKKLGVTQFKYVYNQKVTITDTIKEKNEENRVTVAIGDDELMGIDEPASIYVFSTITKMSIYPLTWTPD